VRNHYIVYLATIQPSSAGIRRIDSGFADPVYRRITNTLSVFPHLPQQKEGGTIEATLPKTHLKPSLAVVKTTIA
jgi:hypothetical protein